MIEKMKHAAKDDDEQDTSDDDHANNMKSQGFDSAFCEHVLQILDMTLPEPRIQSSAIQFGLVGTMESGPLKARKKNVLKLLMNPHLNLEHQQRCRQARRCPLRTSKIQMSIRLLLQLQNQRKQSLLTFISHEMMMQAIARAQDMKFILSGNPLCENVIQIPDRTLPESRF